MTWAHAQSGRGTLSRNSCEHTTHSGSYRLVPRASAGQHVQVKVRLAPFVKPAADELAGMQPDGTASNRRAINGLYYRGRCRQSAVKRRGSLELRRPATDQRDAYAHPPTNLSHSCCAARARRAASIIRRATRVRHAHWITCIAHPYSGCGHSMLSNMPAAPAYLCCSGEPRLHTAFQRLKCAARTLAAKQVAL